ncbi:manganese efflux pump MntP [Marinilabilia sp.]
MTVFSFLIIGIGLSVDSMAASVTTGACSARIKLKDILKVAAFMSFFQASMPLIGWFIGSSFKNVVQAYDHWIALFMLVLIGGKMIMDGLKEQDSEVSKCLCPSNHLMLTGMAFATSIDALVAGIGFGILSINIWLATMIIGVITFVFSVAGVILGKTIGTRLNMGMEIIGGIVLIGLGVKIFLSHTYLG